MLLHELSRSSACFAHSLRRPCSSQLAWRYPRNTHRVCVRVLNSTSWLQRERVPQRDAQKPVPPKIGLVESVKPESVEKAPPSGSREPPKTDALLTEQTVSNKEQRKADWAIMKEMARYLWPKVAPLVYSRSLPGLTSLAG